MSQNSQDQPANAPVDKETRTSSPLNADAATPEQKNGDLVSLTENPQDGAGPADNEAKNAPSAKPPAPETDQANEPSIIQASTGAWAGVFHACAKGGPIVLLLALFCMAWHDFFNPANAIYCPAEFKAITAFLHCVAQSSWLTPTGLDAGTWSIAQWPGFFWFTGLLALIPGLGVSDLLLPVVEFTAAALALIAIWQLAITARFGSRAAFAAGLMAIACPLFAPLPHFMGAAALATAFFLFALIFFYRGWTAENAFISLPLAFIFTALAGLTGGFLLFAIPLAASLCFIIWRGNLKRAQKADALFGFILFLAIIGAWLGWIMLGHGNSGYLSQLVDSSLAFDWPLRHLWWAALAAGFLGTLPWLLTIFGVSWLAVIKNAGKTLSASRHDNGSALIWISLVLTAAASIWIPQFHPAAVTIASLFLVLAGKAFLQMPVPGNRFFFFLASLLTLFVGLLLLAMHFNVSQSWILEMTKAPVPDLARETLLSLRALPVVAGILVVGGICGFYFARRYQHGGGLLYALLLVIILCQPGRLMLVPELGENPALPVRNYAFIQGEVEKALQPAATPVPVETQQPVPAPTETPPTPPAQDAPAGEALPPALQNPEPSGQPAQTIPSGPDLPAPPAGGEAEIIIIEPGQNQPAPPAQNPEFPQENMARPGKAPGEQAAEKPAPPVEQEEIIVEEIKPKLPETPQANPPALPEGELKTAPAPQEAL